MGSAARRRAVHGATPQEAALLLALGALLAVAATAAELQAVETAGVNVPETLEVPGRTLRLNGSAVMKRMVFKVYVAALYLPEPTHDVSTVIAADEPKALVLHFQRAIPRQSLVEAINNGLAANAPELAVRARSEVEKLVAAVTDMKAGDRLEFVYLPGEGSTVTMSGGPSVTLAGKDFADAYLLLYLGPKPPRADLKKQLLGL